MPRPRPAWREPRFLLGIVLVVASVAGVAGLVAASDRSVEVFAARHALAAGDEVSAKDLVGVRVRLGKASSAYLSARPQADTVVTRTIAAGELVPVGALGAASAQRETSVVISVDGELPASIDVGSAVDVWSAEATGEGAGAPKFGAPRVLVPDGTVVRVVRDSGLGASGGVAVEVRVPKDSTAQLLESLANGDDITVLPAGA
ncbi:hypothetical protein GCM10022286_28590 [Gryllotalpicola daejeonensis]|uniref:SAF domain-containing protein n=1 Tax=Gryllotalpicola daejeonensis TaxID=993087 RepID=A0ABP7ZN45_9MICO